MLKRLQNRGFEIVMVLMVTAALLYCSWPLGYLLNPLAEKTGLASELGAYHQPYNWLFIGADVLSGIFLALSCYLLARMLKYTGWRKFGLVLLAVYGICGALDAALPLNCLPSEGVCGAVLHSPMLIIHGIIDITGSIALVGTLGAEWLYAKHHHPSWLPWIYIVGGGGLIFGVLSAVFLVLHGPGYWAQRYYITLSCVWVGSLPFVFRAQSRSRHQPLGTD